MENELSSHRRRVLPKFLWHNKLIVSAKDFAGTCKTGYYSTRVTGRWYKSAIDPFGVDLHSVIDETDGISGGDFYDK